jgi:signal transduction histidine kinase
MKFLRNKEIIRQMTGLGVLTILFAVAAFFVQWYCSIIVLAVAVCFCLVFLISTKKRYDRIEKLSEKLNLILHGQDFLAIDDNQEGELAILESEIYKMTVKLREHSYALQKEKIYLTDSIADISHQVRTPLTTINLIMSFMQKKNLSEEKRLEYNQEINHNLIRIDWLISSLLKISKIDAGTAGFKNEHVDVCELIDRSFDPLLIPIEIRQQTFSLEVTGKPGFMGDINWTCEALGNILKNCMEHTPEGGHLKVTAQENALYTEIIITDTGKGIDPEDMPHLFERFYKGKNASDSSTGIGLALARMIVQKQNGSIKLENRIEGGAKFTIRFYKKPEN